MLLLAVFTVQSKGEPYDGTGNSCGKNVHAPLPPGAPFATVPVQLQAPVKEEVLSSGHTEPKQRLSQMMELVPSFAIAFAWALCALKVAAGDLRELGAVLKQ
eukprot:gene21746-28767_t